MSNTKNTEISVTYMLVPIALMAFTMMLFFAFQTKAVLQERNVLNQASVQLNQPFQNSQKLNAQFGGLVKGTQMLANEGSESAKDLVKDLVRIGILPDPAKQQVNTPVPAANDTAKGPVKP